jgi:DNA-binding response OmpR family regulator
LSVLHGRVSRVLLVEDEPRILDAMRRVLVAEHYVVDTSATVGEALALAELHAYDVVVLDRVLPDGSGLDVIRGLRARAVATPVLMVTALSALEHRVEGLDAGADDYLGKPFAFSELLARMRALTRRAPGLTAERLASGPILLDPLRHQVTVNGRSELLSAREYALLGYLIRNAGNVVTRQQILDSVWGAEPDVYSNVVDLYIHYLRRKLAALGLRNALRTVRGVGYALNAS